MSFDYVDCEVEGDTGLSCESGALLPHLGRVEAPIRCPAADQRLMRSESVLAEAFNTLLIICTILANPTPRLRCQPMIVRPAASTSGSRRDL